MPTKVFLSTPCYGGLCLEQFSASVIMAIDYLKKHDIEVVIDTTENESLVHRARNISVARFLKKSDADFFMFIDADIHFNPESILRLVKSGHDIAVAAYPKKCIMWDDAAKCIKAGDTRDPVLMSSSLVMNFKSQKSKIENGFIEVLDGPTGFMCIKRSVIERMYEHYKDELFCKNDHMNRDLDDYVAVFDCMIDPVNKRYLSEDYAFCRRWQQMGGQIFADAGTTLGHVGNLQFHGNMHESLKA